MNKSGDVLEKLRALLHEAPSEFCYRAVRDLVLNMRDWDSILDATLYITDHLHTRRDWRRYRGRWDALCWSLGCQRWGKRHKEPNKGLHICPRLLLLSQDDFRAFLGRLKSSRDDEDNRLDQVLAVLSHDLGIFEHPDEGYVFLLKDESVAPYEDTLEHKWDEQGERICDHDSTSARADGFSLIGDASLSVTRYPSFTSEAEFVAAIVYHHCHWWSEHPHCGWTLDVRAVPQGGWSEIISGVARISHDATVADVFPDGEPGDIERVIAIIDDGNTRWFAILASGVWVLFAFETS